MLLELKKRLLEISYHEKLSHIGSCITTLPIILEIFLKKKHSDIFILSNGHAGLALYVILEKFYGINAIDYIHNYGIHPVRNEIVNYSTGSLGMGIAASVGFALANRAREVYCIISDGECAEGIVWESLRIIDELKLRNIKIYCNVNGYSAYSLVDKKKLIKRLRAFLPGIEIVNTDSNQFSFMAGLKSHYHVMTKDEYETALCELSC